ncbi:MAG: choice-of-anchor Q domain-containing protein [Dehalococcoidia bacterium]
MTVTNDPAPGACNSHCSLREAIKAANANADANIIVIPDIAPAGPDTFILTRDGPIEDANAFGDLDILNPVTIKGSGTTATVIDGNGLVLSDRVVQAACSSACAIRLQDLTLTGGRSVDDAIAGGLLVEASNVVTLATVAVEGNSGSGGGGGVSNEGEFHAVNSTFSGNTSSGAGGGLANEGLMVLASVTVDGNDTGSGGGGLINAGDLTITNGTIYGNTAEGGGDDIGGGGIFLDARANPSGSVNLHSTTIANNTTAGHGGGIGQTHDVESTTQTVVMRNSIVADNSAAAFSGCGRAQFIIGGFQAGNNMANDISHEGHNVDEDGTCGGDIAGDPGLGPLAFNGGFVETASIGVNSNALDAADPANPGSGGASCPSLDARGMERPHDADGDNVPQCDIGSYEVGTCEHPFGPTTLVATVPGIVGTGEADVIVGTRYADEITELGGSGVVCGGRGNDRIFGGNGDEGLFGENGNDSIFGELGDDFIQGGAGKDLLDGGPSGTLGDLLQGGTQGDLLKGGLGNNDFLEGEGGADRLSGGGGTGDSCDGGTGGDAFVGVDAAAAGCESSTDIP